ncbi:SUMF1/EgtB/PvdO family nonheme iron enzyme [Gimesia aquarii]|uniref:Serine/threonine-protein kinase pkn1 n=1 Tax=Gimesia aquarii TaxID=2527964 RepID=A0A517VU36_9PLAN|nr:SUMF1/EgtB/PvdO family nonheme iron enzyme [Gimesia aquarii]QDT96522.1 Serine/threonine-protein kinase pkn1 [Gimesia aquarii]
MCQYQQNNRHRNLEHSAGFSVRDLILALIVVGIFFALLSPYVLSMRDTARLQNCQSNMRQLGVALQSYHETNSFFPPAAVWSTEKMHSLALHISKRGDLFIQANWAQMLLPYMGQEQLAEQSHSELPVSHVQNQKTRETSLSIMNCPSDPFNRANNHYKFNPNPELSLSFARGNYAFNGGTNCYKVGMGTTASPNGDWAHILIDKNARSFQYWGNGIGGFNKSFSVDDFNNGLSTLVALDEVRAGIHPLDPRGVWAWGNIASSVTWGHGVNGDDFGPNNQWPRSDDFVGCGKLHDVVGTETITKERMPCVSYVDINQNATARSLHHAGVNVLFLDGRVRFIHDQVDPGLWHVMHSRETPENVLANDFEARLQVSDFEQEAHGANDSHTASNRIASKPNAFSNSIDMKFILIPAGEFQMGLPDEGYEIDLAEETPPHSVIISKPFYLGCFEVTQREYQMVMSQNPSFHGSDTGNVDESEQFPVEQVSWMDVQRFCENLNQLAAEKKARRYYRLPTEAEWEYACRSGSTQPYPFQSRRSEDDRSGAAAGIQPSLPVTRVGMYPANEFGLYDMRGNVWEWCSDWFDRDYYRRSPRVDPQGPSDGFIKVIRGGDWIFVGEDCRINYPVLPPWKSSPFVGFRVICEHYPN